MDKNDVKGILMSMRNAQNEEKVTNILGKIDLLPEEKLQTMLAEIGENEENIRKYFEEKLERNQENANEKHTPINKMFSYGVNGNCAHLHLPIDLREMLNDIGKEKTMNIVNLYLFDAIDRIRKLQDDGFYKLNEVDEIHMMSPILLKRERKFLEELGFETRLYKKKELQNEEFLAENSEAQLARSKFGKDRRVGVAKISLKTINTQEWQDMKNKKVKEFASNGITLSKDEEIK